MRNLPIIAIFLLSLSCQSQTTTEVTRERSVGGPCEGCEALLEFGTETLKPVDTLPMYIETDPKMIISGTVFHKDGKTPASDVIVYIYHTNRGGIYETKGDEKGWDRRHGFIRGWVKTDKSGRYKFYTFRPGPYPGRSNPEHVHITIKEPNTVPYYIDPIMFTDDPLLTADLKNRMGNRGGNGIITPVNNKNGHLEVVRDIILGMNIPDY